MDVDKQETAPEFSVPLENVFVKEGEDVKLECKVTGSPTPKVIWLKDGREVDTNSRKEVIVA